MRNYGKVFGIALLATLFVAALIGVALWLALTTGTSYQVALLVIFVLVGVAIGAGYVIAANPVNRGFWRIWRRDPRDDDDVMRDARRVRDTFLIIAAAGILGIFIYSLQFKLDSFAHVFGSAIVTAVASMTIGIAIGFLFGIPRTLQGDNPAPAPPAAGGGTASATAARSTPNTNLEQISDWLTKIIVGLGLVHLTKVPEYLGRLLRKIGPYLNHDTNLALGIVLGYATCGFLLGYLLTRLYLTRALVRAQLVAEELISNLLRGVTRDTRNTLDQMSDANKGAQDEEVAATATGPDNADNEPVSTAEAAAAKELQELARSSGNLPELRKHVDDLAAEYERIRRDQPSGWNRTRNMEIVASKMRALSLACYGLLPQLTTSPSPGHRLAAVSFLEVQASRGYIPWLQERFAIEQPFVAYHAAWALRQAARQLPVTDLPAVETAIVKALDVLGPDTSSDRVATLKAALDELGRRRKEA